MPEEGPFEKHPHNNNILINHAKWQLNKVQPQILKGSRGREVWDLNSFFQDYGPDMPDITTFAVLSSFPTNVCSQIGYLIYAVIGTGKRSWKMGSLGVKKKKKTSSHLGFPIVLTVHLIYNHCSPVLISLIQEQTVATLPGLQEGKSLATRIILQAQWTSSTKAIIFTNFVAAALTWKSRGLSFDASLRFRPFSMSQFWRRFSEEKKIAIRSSSACGPLWIGVPGKVGKLFVSITSPNHRWPQRHTSCQYKY